MAWCLEPVCFRWCEVILEKTGAALLLPFHLYSLGGFRNSFWGALPSLTKGVIGDPRLSLLSSTWPSGLGVLEPGMWGALGR